MSDLQQEMEAFLAEYEERWLLSGPCASGLVKYSLNLRENLP